MSQSLLKIGQVLSLLRVDHPDLELSKIRYYEDKGLVLPSRTKKGYRLYSENDIACLREAIRLADQEFLPLRMIRHRLIEAGLLEDTMPKAATVKAAKTQREGVSLAVPTPEVTEAPARPTLRVVTDPTASVHVSLDAVPAAMSLEELVARTGVSAISIELFVKHGFLTPSTGGAGQIFAAEDIAIVVATDRLVANGADLRILGGLRRVAERELGILQDLTSQVVATARSGHEASATVAATHRDIDSLRAALVARGLSDIFPR